MTIPLHYLHQRVQIAQGNVQIAQNQAQIHQLAMMNWHMQQQQAAHAYQANLQQALAYFVHRALKRHPAAYDRAAVAGR